MVDDQQSNRVIQQAVSGEWTGRRRWDTDITPADIAPTADGLSARDIAVNVTIRNMLSAEPRVSTSAVRNLIAMEAQNQRDDTGPDAPPPGVTVNVQNNNVVTPPGVSDVVRGLLEQGDYIEFLRAKAQGSKDVQAHAAEDTTRQPGV